MSFILLTYFQDRATFESAVVFFMIGIAAVWAASKAKDEGYEPFEWRQGMDRNDLKYMVGGYVALLVAGFGLTPLGGPLVTLSAAGAILFVVMYKSQSIMTAWFAHAFYNISAVALATFSIIPLAASPIYVPDYSAAPTQQTLGDFANQAFLQFFSVAFAEEILKVSLAIGIGILFFQNYDSQKAKVTAMAISALLWVALHTILSYQIKLF